MLWLAPPLLFTLGVGANNPDHAEPGPLLVAAVGYPVSDGAANVGLRVRASHTRLKAVESYYRDGVQIERFGKFGLYTLDVCAYGEVDAGRWLFFTLWVGAHASGGEGTFDETPFEPGTGMTRHETETLVSEPALAVGALFGLNAYRSERYRVSAFFEAQTSVDIFLTDRSQVPTYRWTPLSFGVAVSFR